jgi:cytochrome c2
MRHSIMTWTVKNRPGWLGSHRWPAPSRAMTLRLNILILLLAGGLAFPVLAASEVSEAAAIFGKRCSGCHTYGKGIRVGPDLKGVTDRHTRSWLLLFIRSSQSVIRAGDPKAVALFRQFKQQLMPDHDLSPQQIESLLDYLASGGPESVRRDERDAESATPAEINRGRRLFYGEAHLAHAGPACSSCHSVQDAGWAKGGSLGPDLTAAYLKYQDKALTSFLQRPCFPRAPELSGAAFLTPEESFGLKAYLRQVSLPQTQITMRAGILHPGGTATLIERRGSHSNTKGDTP